MAAGWSSDELQALRAMLADGASKYTIASTLGRTAPAVATKMRDLGLRASVRGPRTINRNPDLKWDAAKVAKVRAWLAEGMLRDDLARACRLGRDDIKAACHLNGLGVEYEEAMKLRVGRQQGGQNVREASEEANRKASEALARAMSGSRFSDAKPVERAPLTFEQQLELVRQGKARVVEKAPMTRPLAYVPSLIGGSMS